MTLLSGIFADTPIDREEIPQVLLDIEDKQRSSPFPWKGQFSPQFVEAMLQAYAHEKAVLLDPFLGSGTVLYEAARLGLAAYGTEINPAAHILANIYKFVNVSVEQREEYLSTFSARLKASVPESLPLFQAGQEQARPRITKDILVELVGHSENAYLTSLHEALIVLLDFYNKKEFTSLKVLSIAETISGFVRRLPYSERVIEAFNADARKMPLQDGTINLVVTSPPYINVFNYHQQYRASTEALNWNLLQVAKSEFGSNRKHRSNRFLTVIQYCLDMAATFKELLRLCSANSRMIFVVGKESKVRGTSFLNGELVAETAYNTFGLGLALRQERQFTNRYGQSIKEDILHFVNQKSMGQNQLNYDKPRAVAVRALEAAYSYASIEAKVDIRNAMEKAGNVELSPYYDQSLSRGASTKKEAHV